MTIPFFCTSESPIRQILKSTVWLRRPFLVFNFTSNTPSMHPKTNHSGKFIFLGSEWAFSHLNKFDMLNSPPGNVFACIHIHLSELSSFIRFPETSLRSIYYCFCCWSFFFFFFLTIVLPCNSSPAMVNWIFVYLIVPLTAAQAELIISCVCQVVILFISLLQFSSHICQLFG